MVQDYFVLDIIECAFKIHGQDYLVVVGTFDRISYVMVELQKDILC